MMQKELAVALNLDVSVVSRYVKKGMPTHSVEAAQAWRRQHIGVRSKPDSGVASADAGRAPVLPVPHPVERVGVDAVFPPLGPDELGDEDFQMARTRREIAEANLAEMREAELEGKLIRVDVMRAAWAKRVSSTRDALLQIPSRVSPALAALTDVEAVARVLEDELRQALAELSRESAQLAAQRGADGGA